MIIYVEIALNLQDKKKYQSSLIGKHEHNVRNNNQPNYGGTLWSSNKYEFGCPCKACSYPCEKLSNKERITEFKFIKWLTNLITILKIIYFFYFLLIIYGTQKRKLFFLSSRRITKSAFRRDSEVEPVGSMRDLNLYSGHTSMITFIVLACEIRIIHI